RDHGYLRAAQARTRDHGDIGHSRARHRGVHRAGDHVSGRADHLRHGATHGARTGEAGPARVPPMKLFRMTMRTALRALRRNKLRSALTMLGIIIGVAAVITMVSIGQGADAAVQKQILSLGNNMLMVIPGATTSSGVRSGWGGVSTLTAHDAGAIKKDCPSVGEV